MCDFRPPPETRFGEPVRFSGYVEYKATLDPHVMIEGVYKVCASGSYYIYVDKDKNVHFPWDSTYGLEWHDENQHLTSSL
jgi:hypothetical protein